MTPGIKQTLAHVSDLHFGLDQHEHAATALVQQLLRASVEHVIVSGDVTHRGRQDELERFWACFSPLRAVARVSLVPGNHDRLGDDVAAAFMSGERVHVTREPGLRLVRLDSTGPHNRRMFHSHGLVRAEDLLALDRALADPDPGEVVVVTMHHHPLPLPEDTALERLSARLRLPFTRELGLGPALLECLRGRCDLLLHGHRHRPSSRAPFADDARPLQVVNAGSSTELRRVRLFEHHGGRLLGPARWLHAPEPTLVTGREPGARPRVGGLPLATGTLLTARSACRSGS